MKKIMHHAAKLSAAELQALIDKLTRVHAKKVAREEEQSIKEREAKEAIAKARDHIAQMASDRGLSLEKLGIFPSGTTAVTAKPKRRTLQLENQVFEIQGDALKMVFTRQAKKLMEKGQAKRYVDLSDSQKPLPKARLTPI